MRGVRFTYPRVVAMPIETPVIRCGNCGAPLQQLAPDAETLTCSYCNEVTWRAPTSRKKRRPRKPPHTARATPDVGEDFDDLLDRLELGPLGSNVGRARRLGPTEAPLRDPMVVERSIWPSGAEASSTFGGGWSPSAMIGPPRVYPSHGDIRGAWAPGPANSPAEWVEAHFAVDVPVTAVRVYETNRAGSTFAVVDTSRGAELLYAGPVEPRDGAMVLEVALDAPRVLRSVRVFVVNRNWAEIDTVALVAAAPLPSAQRVAFTPRTARSWPCAIWALLVVFFGVIVAVGAVVAYATLRSPSAEEANAASSTPPAVSSALSGNAFTYTQATPAVLASRGVQWASSLAGFSSSSPTPREPQIQYERVPC
ncbi:MAG TPA: discoidin domain-containing protein, partial [Polyangiaceae bacterium]|nr:discoidin domain-containing protein [Polyangiaceae bacterium]HOD23820.1 discoidin domain-containing protein [Polyangiaceae bacterium]HOH02163.1 discoidin domain-containing protein [Polyangiaceae bacterium]HOR38010.1 discoidin domain-containing protein [Polyangiaceae bacterium]HPK94037.1 discoidin domain-containing protein [Polyangiaceae bacterium]